MAKIAGPRGSRPSDSARRSCNRENNSGGQAIMAYPAQGLEQV